MTYEAVREIALALPQVEEGTCYGTPALRVRGKLLARLREDGETLVLRVDPFERDQLLSAHPETYSLTDHYRPYPYVLVQLPLAEAEALHELLERAWALHAPKRLVAAHARQSASVIMPPVETTEHKDEAN